VRVRRTLPLLAAALLVFASQAGATSRPTLRATRVALLTVVGVQFPPGRWIRVTASAGAASSTKLVRASLAGRFAASFGFRVSPCRTTALVVAQLRGSSTRLAELRVSAGKCR
jgi:hypothetical protein